MRKHLITGIAAAVLAVAAFLILSPLGLGGTKAGASGSKQTDDKPKTMNFLGTWHQVSGRSDIVMTAEISAGAIQINMNAGDTDNVYWLGTFDTDMTDIQRFTMISTGDQDAMANMIFASQDATKKFTYSDGILSFDFTMLGSKTTVRLSK